MKLAGLIYGLTNGPRGWSAFLHFYYKKIVAQTMALVCTTNVSMFLNVKSHYNFFLTYFLKEIRPIEAFDYLDDNDLFPN